MTGGFVAQVPAEMDIEAIRAKLNLGWHAFAERFGFRTAGVRHG